MRTEALNSLSTDAYDLVILDMVMPIMNGTEVLLEIRLNPSTAERPVVMITGSAEEGLIRDVMRLGVTDYLVKPIVTRDVLDRLQDVMNKVRPASSEETKPQPVPNRSLALMVVDQDDKFCNLFSSAVGRTHRVVEATNGAQALSLALKNPPDAIFLGDNLGVFSRRGVVRKIRELPSLQNLKVFAVAEETLLNTVPALSYDGTMPKVLDLESLKEHLERVLFATPEAPPPLSHEPDLQADLMPAT